MLVEVVPCTKIWLSSCSCELTRLHACKPASFSTPARCAKCLFQQPGSSLDFQFAAAARSRHVVPERPALECDPAAQLAQRSVASLVSRWLSPAFAGPSCRGRARAPFSRGPTIPISQSHFRRDRAVCTPSPARCVGGLRGLVRRRVRRRPSPRGPRRGRGSAVRQEEG
jgi:hypothetical protein